MGIPQALYLIEFKTQVLVFHNITMMQHSGSDAVCKIIYLTSSLVELHYVHKRLSSSFLECHLSAGFHRYKWISNGILRVWKVWKVWKVSLGQ